MDARCWPTIRHLESGLEFRLVNMFDAPAVRNQDRGYCGTGLRGRGLDHRQRAAVRRAQLEKFTYFMVLLLIVLVAAFNIIATLVMVVMERRKEIAILRTMGARAGSVA